MYNMKTSSTVDDHIEDTPDIGKRGYFSISPYTELVHFLVVRKILSRFRKVYYVMDGSKTLYSAALTALVPDIREERAEIVLFQHDKKPADYAPCLSLSRELDSAEYLLWRQNKASQLPLKQQQ